VFTVTITETSGPLAIHVNPGGVVSELITVSAIAAVSLNGFPVLHDTWYPGYVAVLLRLCCCFMVGSPYVIGQTIYIFILFLSFFFLSFFISSPNLSGRTLNVCHTSTHGVALV